MSYPLVQVMNKGENRRKIIFFPVKENGR